MFKLFFDLLLSNTCERGIDMAVLEHECIDIIIQDAISDNNVDRLLDVLFSKEDGIDSVALISFIKERASMYSFKYDIDTNKKISEYIDQLSTDNSRQENFVLNLGAKLCSQIPSSQSELTQLNYMVFWSMFAIAEKKCIGLPTVKITDPSNFFKMLPPLTPNQENAHTACIKAFNLNADSFSLKANSQLRLFLHPFHSKNKRLRTKKKNLNRVLKTTKKIMQVHKINHRKNAYNIFSGKSYIVPEQFTKMIVNLFLY